MIKWRSPCLSHTATGSLHHLHNHHHPSLREQLHFTITNSAPQSTATTPGTARTIFGRLGIRKPSILSLSLSSPHANVGGETANRTFSLDDLLRPPARRKTDRKCFRQFIDERFKKQTNEKKIRKKHNEKKNHSSLTK